MASLSLFPTSGTAPPMTWFAVALTWFGWYGCIAWFKCGEWWRPWRPCLWATCGSYRPPVAPPSIYPLWIPSSYCNKRVEKSSWVIFGGRVGVMMIQGKQKMELMRNKRVDAVRTIEDGTWTRPVVPLQKKLHHMHAQVARFVSKSSIRLLFVQHARTRGNY